MLTFENVRAAAAAGAITIFTAATGAALAQDYPSQPIHLIVGYSAGGATDLSARLIGEKLSEELGVPVVVENRTGAGGQIANEYVARADADGYTVAYHDGAMLTAPALGTPVNYDWKTDLVPVAVAISVPHFLYVNADFPADDIEGFVSYLKEHPNEVFYGSAGVGTPNHLSPLLVLQSTGTEAKHTPYQGGAAAMADVVAGRIQFGMTSATATVPMATEGRIKALAYAGAKRSSLLPEVPTFDETILPGFEAGNWFDFAVPAGTPDDVVKKLNQAILTVLEDPELVERLAKEGAETIGLSPEESAAFLQSEADRFADVIDKAGIKLD